MKWFLTKMAIQQKNLYKSMLTRGKNIFNSRNQKEGEKQKENLEEKEYEKKVMR